MASLFLCELLRTRHEVEYTTIRVHQRIYPIVFLRAVQVPLVFCLADGLRVSSVQEKVNERFSVSWPRELLVFLQTFS